MVVFSFYISIIFFWNQERKDLRWLTLITYYAWLDKISLGNEF